MEKPIEKQVFSNRKRKGETISLYFNKDDMAIYEFIEQYSKKHNIARGRVVIEMLKSLGFMCAFSDYWVKTTKKGD